MFAILATRCFHSNNLLPTNALLSEIVPIIVATIAFFSSNYIVQVWKLGLQTNSSEAGVLSEPDFGSISRPIFA